MIFEKSDSGLLKSSFPLSLLYLAVGMIFFVLLLYNHFQLITASVPLDYYESSMPAITSVIAQGQNPYTLESVPSNTDVYPPLYNIIVAPITLIFGNTLQVHRLVAGIFIIASCLVCFFVTLKSSRSPLHSMAAAVILYAALLYYSTPVASPNSTGMFFFMLSIVVPWIYRFSDKSLAMALIFGLLAFYSKQYFVVGLLFLCLYLFIAISIKRALVYGLFVGFGAVTSLAIVYVSSPYYLDNTIFSIRDLVDQVLSYEVMFKQLDFFCRTYSSFLVLLLLTGGYAFWKNYRATPGRKTVSRRFAINLKALDEPLISKKPDYFWFCFMCASVVIILILGRNPGNYMTYLFQLMSPFLLIAGFTFIEKSGCHSILLYPFIFYCFFQTYTILPRDFSINPTHKANWDRLVALMNDHDHIYTSPVLLMPVVEGRKKIYANGHTRYFNWSRNKPDFFQKVVEEERVSSIWKKHVLGIYELIEAQKFDLIVLDRSTRIPNSSEDMKNAKQGMRLLQKFYKRRKILPVSLVDRPGGGKVVIQIWQPKNFQNRHPVIQ